VGSFSGALSFGQSNLLTLRVSKFLIGRNYGASSGMINLKTNKFRGLLSRSNLDSKEVGNMLEKPVYGRILALQVITSTCGQSAGNKIMEEVPNPRIRITPEQYADLAELNFQATQKWQKIEEIIKKATTGNVTDEDIKEMQKLSSEHTDFVNRLQRMMEDLGII